MPSERKTRLDSLALTLLVLCCALWGFQQILITFALTDVPPMWQSGMRFWGAARRLGLWCGARGVPLFQRDGTLMGGLLAGLLFSAEFLCIYLGLQLTSASRLTVFLYTSPFVVTILLPRVVPREGLRRVQWLGLLIAFAAVATAFSEGFFSGAPVAGQWRGDLLPLGAGLFWGLTTLTIRASGLSTASAEKTLFYRVAAAALVSPLLSLAMGESWGLSYSAMAWGSIALQT